MVKPRTAAGARISAGAVWLLWVVAGAVIALFLFGSIVSFAGLYSIASWLGLPNYLYWAFPLAVDLGIVVYKVAEVVLRYDPRKANKVRKAVFGTILFTTVSCIGNIVHVATIADPDPLKFWGGIFFAGLMPWAVYLAASVLSDLVVKPLHAQAVDKPVETEREPVDKMPVVKMTKAKPKPRARPAQREITRTVDQGQPVKELRLDDVPWG